ncbi:hypothetical protein [Cryptosporangium minutisporangium]|uniref:Uncharacterized protein n=1 Tax=Cryptosporangium minutisporangium TaxID=113569 RepID=A0ABP6T224_9ACTN
MDESRTRALLTGVVDTAPPPAPVDVRRVIEMAQARERARTRWVITTAAALVLVVTVAVTSLMLGTGTDRAASPAGPGQEQRLKIEKLPAEKPHGSLPLPGTVPTRFDLLRSELLVGEVPDELSERGTWVRFTSLGFYASAGNKDVSIAVGSRGAKLTGELGNKIEKTIAGPSINGYPSTLNFWGQDWGWELRWNWAPDAQARVSVRGFPEPEKLAAKVATAVRVNLTGHARLPFTLRAPTGGLLSEFQATIDLSGKRRKPSATATYAGPGSGFISVNTNPLGTGIGKADSVYEDRPARIKHERSGNGQGGTFSTMVMAADDLKVTGTCNYNPNPDVTAEEFKELCLSTTASTQRVGNFENASSWPVFNPR